MKINQNNSRYSFVLRIILTVVLIAFSVGLLPSSFMAQTPAGLITRQKLRAVPKSFGQITDCGPAALDPTFGGTGKVTTDVSGSEDSAYSVAVQADGKIVAAGTSYPGPDFAVVRYNSDGSLDPSFGGTGKVTTNVISWDIATSVAIQADGKIVVAGGSGSSGSIDDFALSVITPTARLTRASAARAKSQPILVLMTLPTRLQSRPTGRSSRRAPAAPTLLLISPLSVITPTARLTRASAAPAKSQPILVLMTLPPRLQSRLTAESSSPAPAAPTLLLISPLSVITPTARLTRASAARARSQPILVLMICRLGCNPGRREDRRGGLKR